MSMSVSVRDAIVTELKSASTIVEAAEQDNRAMTAEERAQVKTHFDNAGLLRQRSDEADAMRKQLKDLSDGIGGTAPPTDAPTGGSTAPGTASTGTGASGARGTRPGASFIDSAEYKALLASVPNGRFGEKARVQSQPFAVKSLLTGTDDASAGSLVWHDWRGVIDPPSYMRPLRIRALVSPGSTGSDTVEYVRILGVDNQAGWVPEASTIEPAGSGVVPVTDAEAGVKPMSSITFERDSTTVKTLAHWIPATKRALSDAAQIRTLIDTFLMYGLEVALDDEIMQGDGTGEHLLGIAHTSGVQVQAAATGGQDIFDITRIARRKVLIGGRTFPTAFVMNPIDWEAVELKRNTQGVFYAGGPFAMATPSLWGLPVVESEAVPAGTAWCGDWKKAVLYDREQASIQVTDSHADFFVRNLVAILAELRCAFAVLRPAAFVKLTV
jgi:HK97 family phage major capsid protein